MKILYLSVHEILEYDELRLFTELGHECYSIGAYTNPYGDENRKRPGLPDMPFNQAFHDLAVTVAADKANIPAELFEYADTVIVMHEPSIIENNWERMKHKRVIWRSIGQSIPQVEERLRRFRQEGLQVVRYSPTEQTIKDNIGADATIRFYKDPDEFNGWTGQEKQVVTFAQSMKSRGAFCNFELFNAATEPFKRKVYGPNNDDIGELNGGLLTYTDLKQQLRDSRVYFYTGTHPASYTLNFIEALMTGTPVVAIGQEWGNSKDFPDQRTYEIPSLILNGVNGYQSDEIESLQRFISMLMNDASLAKNIGFRGRQRAIELFGKELIKKQWKAFL